MATEPRGPARRPAVPHPDALVPLGGGRWVAAQTTAAGVSLVLISARPERSQAVASAAASAANSVHLLSYDGATGEEWNTFLYGTAGEGVARVVLDSHRGRGGRVVAGAWVIALRERDVAPDALRWRFVGAGGETIVAGSRLLGQGR